jgi:hypothetical protein
MDTGSLCHDGSVHCLDGGIVDAVFAAMLLWWKSESVHRDWNRGRFDLTPYNPVVHLSPIEHNNFRQESSSRPDQIQSTAVRDLTNGELRDERDDRRMGERSESENSRSPDRIAKSHGKSHQMVNHTFVLRDRSKTSAERCLLVAKRTVETFTSPLRRKHFVAP